MEEKRANGVQKKKVHIDKEEKKKEREKTSGIHVKGKREENTNGGKRHEKCTRQKVANKLNRFCVEIWVKLRENHWCTTLPEIDSNQTFSLV